MIFPVSASRAVPAVSGREFAVIAEREEGIRPFVDAEDDVPAVPPVAAVRTALRDVFFAAEGHHAVPSVSRLDVNLDFVDKHVSVLILIV